jgi:hypothetical protein
MYQFHRSIINSILSEFKITVVSTDSSLKKQFTIFINNQTDRLVDHKFFQKCKEWLPVVGSDINSVRVDFEGVVSSDFLKIYCECKDSSYYDFSENGKDVFTELIPEIIEKQDIDYTEEDWNSFTVVAVITESQYSSILKDHLDYAPWCDIQVKNDFGWNIPEIQVMFDIQGVSHKTDDYNCEYSVLARDIYQVEKGKFHIEFEVEIEH